MTILQSTNFFFYKTEGSCFKYVRVGRFCQFDLLYLELWSMVMREIEAKNKPVIILKGKKMMFMEFSALALSVFIENVAR